MASDLYPEVTSLTDAETNELMVAMRVVRAKIVRKVIVNRVCLERRLWSSICEGGRHLYCDTVQAGYPHAFISFVTVLHRPQQ